jgi:16S rRNA (guanine966-N2)-methyltransferase
MTHGRMRVIAGRLKGRRLLGPSFAGLRPTSDTLRETLFNVLAPGLAGARVLDAYAGTGALGIEALSRGASAVTFIEQDPRAQALIAANLAHCGAAEGCAIIRDSVARALEALSSGPSPASFDIVLLDPPYDVAPETALAGVAGVLAPGGLAVLEHARRRPGPETTRDLIRVRQVVSGDSALSLYERRSAGTRP